MRRADQIAKLRSCRKTKPLKAGLHAKQQVVRREVIPGQDAEDAALVLKIVSLGGVGVRLAAVDVANVGKPRRIGVDRQVQPVPRRRRPRQLQPRIQIMSLERRVLAVERRPGITEFMR